MQEATRTTQNSFRSQSLSQGAVASSLVVVCWQQDDGLGPKEGYGGLASVLSTLSVSCQKVPFQVLEPSCESEDLLKTIKRLIKGAWVPPSHHRVDMALSSLSRLSVEQIGVKAWSSASVPRAHTKARRFANKLISSQIASYHQPPQAERMLRKYNRQVALNQGLFEHPPYLM